MGCNKNQSRIWVAGSRGMAGSAIARQLSNVISEPSREKLDLRRQADVESWMAKNRPDVIYLAAARVGGIGANTANPADFIADNLQIQTNIITTAAKLKVSKLVFLGSSCIYPREAPQPLKEEYLMTGPLEKTNRAYAMAKLAGVELVRSFREQHGCDFISVLPCNLYGPNDTYDLQHSHVIPALMLKIRLAKESNASHVTVWGSGNPMREFLHVDDMANAVIHLASHYNGSAPVNVGSGREISIAELAQILCEVAEFKGRLVFDTSKPDGTPRKVLDITRLSASSWSPKIGLRQGLRETWIEFLSSYPSSLHPPSQAQNQV